MINGPEILAILEEARERREAEKVGFLPSCLELLVEEETDLNFEKPSVPKIEKEIHLKMFRMVAAEEGSEQGAT